MYKRQTMAQRDHLRSDPGVIEALKAATRQVVQPAPHDEHSGSPTMANPVATRGEPKQKPQSMPAPETFAEAFVRKITSVEQEKAAIEKEQVAVDQEIDRVLKLQTGLTEKKEQLENRRNELIKVKDKLKELDKEMSNVLTPQQV